MTIDRPKGDRPLDQLLNFSLDEPVTLDVSYCDVMRAREPNQMGPFEVRIRGTRQPDGALVRSFVAFEEFQDGLLAAGAMLQAVDPSGIPAGERSHLALPLLKYALTITKRRKGNGRWMYDVAVRDSAGAADLAQYLRTLKEVAAQAAPFLVQAGYPVGATEIINMTDSIFAVRVNRKVGGTR